MTGGENGYYYDNSRKIGVDIQSAIERKHEYNQSRPYRHGGKRS
jgi:hypothetical protein